MGPAVSMKEDPLASRFYLAALVAAIAALIQGASLADDLTSYEITFKEHSASPAEIHVASGKPFIVVVKNDTGENDEFEMLIPPVERAVPAGGEGRVRIRPLAPGRFPFFGESDPDNEKGVIVSK